MNKSVNILGDEIIFDCQGCDCANHKIIPSGGYVYEDDFINVAADYEVPIPGFMIIGINKHYSSLNQMSKQERIKVIEILNKTVQIVKDVCSVKDVVIIQEEKSNHFHIWVLPNYDWLIKFGKGSYGIKEKFEYAKSRCNLENINDCLEKTKKIREKFLCNKF